MKLGRICSVLLGALGLFSSQVQAQVSEAEAHILSAFTTTADPRVFADTVTVGPVLRGALGGESDPKQVYQAIASQTAGKMLRVRLVPPGEAARFTSIPGVNATDPLVTLESGDLQLVLQYAPKAKHVSFIEQVSTPIARVAPPKPPVEVVKPVPPVEAPTPPPVVAVPAIPPVAAPAPTFTPAPVPAAPVRAPDRTTKPRGECVVKPVMNEEDLWNCSGPAQPAAAIERPAPPPVAVQKPQAAPEKPASRPTGDCVIKPVMSEEDLRNCASVSRSTPSTPPVVPVVLQKPEPPAPAAPRPRPECVIKPVMTEDDLRNCAAVSTSTPSVRPVVPVAVQKPEPPAPAAPRPRPDCVIKPVMSEEDLRNCAAVSTSAPKAAPVVPVTVQAPPPAAPAAPKRAECVIKPVMTEEDLRACGVRR